MPACNRYLHSRQTLRQLKLTDCPPIAAPELRQSLEIEQFAPHNYPCQPLSASFPARGIVQLSGSSGSGKSGLLQALAGHIPARGVRRVDGEVLPAGLVQQWVYCEQMPIILQGTLRANLVPGEATIPDPELLRALGRLGLDALTDLDEWLGVGGRQLSGGEKKRLALARLLLSDKSVWLLDEPFEALDEKSQQQVVSLFNEAARDRLLIVATHIFPDSLQVSQSIALD